MFELDSVEDARRHTDDFSLIRAGLIEWSFISLQVPVPIGTLLRQEADVRQPYDRTRAAS